jgi:hypothetical protein
MPKTPKNTSKSEGCDIMENSFVIRKSSATINKGTIISRYFQFINDILVYCCEYLYKYTKVNLYLRG